MWVQPLTLRGRVVRLEPLELAHAPGLLAAADPALFHFTPQAPPEWSVAGFESDIRKVTSLPDVVPFAIIQAPTNTVVGRTTYMHIQPDHKGLEIGRTWIGRAHHGSAVNPEIKLLMLTHAFDALGAIRVQFTTSAKNIHSQRAIAKLGAVREGTLRHNFILPDGALRDTVYFSILKSEWPAVRSSLEQRLAAFE